MSRFRQQIAFVALAGSLSIFGCSKNDAVFLESSNTVPEGEVGAESPPMVLPLQVNIQSATEFVLLGFGEHGDKRFQASSFLTTFLSTEQAQQLVRLIPSYNSFEGAKVSEKLGSIKGRVESIQFGREGSPVLYINLPYWTHQREGVRVKGMGTKINDEENEKLVGELRELFVKRLKAAEFGVAKNFPRRVRVWWS
jgi:hypothetical protein